MSAPRLVSIILNWNNYEHTHAFAQSLRSTASDEHEVVIVDNNSPNKSTERIQAEFPQYTYIYNDTNVGIAAANNIAIRYAEERRAAFVFLFNNDLEVIEADFFKKMLAYMDAHPRVAMAAPQLLFPDRRVQMSIKRIPTPSNQISELLRLPQRKIDLSRLKKEGGTIPSSYFVMASALLVRVDALRDIGLEDERFVLGYEDVDWVKRAHEAAREVHFVPRATILHHHGVSSKNAMSRMDFYYGEKLRFLMKHHAFLPIALFRLAVSISSLARAFSGRHMRSHLYLAYRIWTYPWTSAAYRIPYTLPQTV